MHLFLLIGLVAFSIAAVLLRDLLKAAIALAVASIFLALIFFRMSSPFAGVFELSVVAGLITVLFITTITLTRFQQGGVTERRAVAIVFPIFFVLFIIIDIVVMRKLLGSLPAVAAPAETGSFGQVLWNKRTFDLVGQIGVIFAGVFAVLALFRNGGKHD